MYLYHYLAALLFALLILIYLLHKIRWANYFYVLFGIFIIAGFLWFAPLTYGLPLTDSALSMRQWFQSWI